jgi:hypothetical protein
MKKLSQDQLLEIAGMMLAAKTGDFLAVRTRLLGWGLPIRMMLSRGLKRCWTNHNAPVYRCFRKTRTMQFEPPRAHEVELEEYLLKLYRSGGKAILLRPDVYRNGLPVSVMEQLVDDWRLMDGIAYDKRSIRMFCRMIFRKRAHVRENDKEAFYCTEGTFLPMTSNRLKPWTPDVLRNEPYPAPIHAEHLMRQQRVDFIAGNRELYDRIMAA